MDIENRKVLVGDFQRRRHNQKQIAHRFSIDGLVLHAFIPVTERKTEPADNERPTVWNGYASADTGRPQIFPPLDDPEQGAGRTLIHPQQSHQLGQDVVLRARAELKIDGVRAEEILEVHGPGNLIPR